MWTLSPSSLLSLPPSQTYNHTLAWRLKWAHLQWVHAFIGVYAVTFSFKMWSNITSRLRKLETERESDSDREKDRRKYEQQRPALLLQVHSMCVVNEFGELSSLYDSCNWPEDSCYYTSQQGNAGCEWVCVWKWFYRERHEETLWSCTLDLHEFNYN